jgi:hypothetical protein
MIKFKKLFKKASLTLVDGLLLSLCAAALTYVSVPLLVKLSTLLGDAAEPNKHADIQVVGVVVFLGVLFLGVLMVFGASFILGCLVFAMVSGRARLVARIGIVVIFLPVFMQTARRGPRGYFDWLINPSIRENEAKQKAKNELERNLKASGALTVEREPDGIQITNNSDQMVRVQVVFITRSNQDIYQCYPGQSASFPPAPSDEEMNLPTRATRLFLLSEARTNTGSHLERGFDDYAVWGWDEKGVPVFLSPKGHLL